MTVRVLTGLSSQGVKKKGHYFTLTEIWDKKLNLLNTKWKPIQTAYAHGSAMYQVMCMADAHVSVTQHSDCSYPTWDCAVHYVQWKRPERDHQVQVQVLQLHECRKWAHQYFSWIKKGAPIRKVNRQNLYSNTSPPVTQTSMELKCSHYRPSLYKHIFCKQKHEVEKTSE
jgi:hypothetical protein